VSLQEGLLQVVVAAESKLQNKRKTTAIATLLGNGEGVAGILS